MSEPLRVLLVEDDPNDAELVRLELVRGGFLVDALRVDTDAALRDALVKRPWDVVISDFAMPTFDGLRAFEAVKDVGLDIPFIFVSGALGEERAVEAMRSGAKDYFLKGHLSRLCGAVRRELTGVKNRRELRRSDHQTLLHQRRLAMSVEASGGVVFEFWGEDESFFSEQWSGILGYGPGDFPTRERFWDWLAGRVHLDDTVILTQACDSFRDGSSPQFRSSFRMRHKEERWVDVEICVQEFEAEERGENSHLVGALRDLTDRRHLEDQLRHSQRMEAVGQLASGVAHDFNNLLTVILSYSQIGMEMLEANHPLHDKLKLIYTAGKQAEGLTGQLLAFSRKKPIAPRVLCPNELVQGTNRMLGRLLGENVTVVLKTQDDLWNVRIDAGAFEQILMNLSVNARDAMPGGGTLTIETKNILLGDSFGFGHDIAFAPGEYVAVSVSDTGVGMDAATAARIFEPFFTTKEVGKGTGLGLSTCYGIVKQANGYIWVYSEQGLGTTFKVYLPRVLQPTESAIVFEAPSDLGGTETILVAEDDDLLRELVSTVLSQKGYRVIEAKNAEDALEQSDKHSEKIDLLLTDFIMPGMHGERLAATLRGARPSIKVILMSGYTPTSPGELGLAMLEKPFSPASLCTKVRQELDSSR